MAGRYRWCALRCVSESSGYGLSGLLSAHFPRSLDDDIARHLTRVSRTHPSFALDVFLGLYIFGFKHLAGDLIRSSARQHNPRNAARTGYSAHYSAIPACMEVLASSIGIPFPWQRSQCYALRLTEPLTWRSNRKAKFTEEAKLWLRASGLSLSLYSFS